MFTSPSWAETCSGSNLRGLFTDGAAPLPDEPPQIEGVVMHTDLGQVNCQLPQ